TAPRNFSSSSGMEMTLRTWGNHAFDAERLSNRLKVGWPLGSRQLGSKLLPPSQGRRPRHQLRAVLSSSAMISFLLLPQSQRISTSLRSPLVPHSSTKRSRRHASALGSGFCSGAPSFAAPSLAVPCTKRYQSTSEMCPFGHAWTKRMGTISYFLRSGPCHLVWVMRLRR